MFSKHSSFTLSITYIRFRAMSEIRSDRIE